MKFKRLLIALLAPMLYFVQVQAQARPVAKQPARPDSTAPGVLCEGAQGQQGILYKKAGGSEFHRINTAATAVRPASPATTEQAVKPAASKTTITKSSSIPAKTTTAPAAAKAAPPKAAPPPILEEHH
ncbi:MAG: hypothetical protein JST39_21925 [Bacteroidetes bacterium]|nr:hypothetical protein [Bacteroidota bacterium]